MVFWKDEYMIGVPQIDEQHKKLFDIAGRIYSVLKNELYVDKYDKIVELIEELKDYTKYHFGFEQEYMQSIGYKRFFSHKVEHDDFIEKINNIDYRAVDEDHNSYLLDMLNFVVKWINDHILEKDKMITAG